MAPDRRHRRNRRLPAGRARALRDEGGFSYRNAYMAEIDGEVAGTMVGYPLFGESRDLSGCAALWHAGWWNWNWRYRTTGTSTFSPSIPEYRGRGIGTALLERADELGSHANTRGMAIIVASGNEDAYRLYQRQGYRLFRKRPAPPPFPAPSAEQDWLLLTKPHG